MQKVLRIYISENYVQENVTSIEPTSNTSTQHTFVDNTKKDCYMFRLLKISIIRPYITQSIKAIYNFEL